MKNYSNSAARVLSLSLAFGLLLVLSSVGYSQGAEFVSIQSSNYPGKYIRHSNSLGILSTVAETDVLATKDSSFKMVKGLAGGDSWSFESVNFPGYFLRHLDYRMILAIKANDKDFKESASFREVPALNGRNGVSYRSFNYPTSYIRHRDNKIWCEDPDGTDLFKNDATWFRMEAWATRK